MIRKIFLIGLFAILLSSIVFPTTASKNGGFKYSVLSEQCTSGPSSPAGYEPSGQIRLEGDFLVGPCNGTGDTPSWGSEECCLQVCENYSIAGLHCDLKTQYAAMLEQELGGLESYKARRALEIGERALEPPTLSQFFSVNTEMWFLSGFLLVLYALYLFVRHRDASEVYSKFAIFVSPSKNKTLIALGIFFFISILGLTFILPESKAIYVYQIDANLIFMPGLLSLLYFFQPQPLVVQILAFSSFLSALLL